MNSASNDNVYCKGNCTQSIIISALLNVTSLKSLVWLYSLIQTLSKHGMSFPYNCICHATSIRHLANVNSSCFNI